MTKKLLVFILLLDFSVAFSQTNPAITGWLQNTTGIKGRHYVNGNSTPIQDNDSANILQVYYSGTSAYIRTNGIPAYITGPFLDGNPSIATSQNRAIFKFPLNPVQNTGTPTATTGGNIGLFINGVALFDYRDGVSWRSASNSLCGGPIMPPCTGDGVWNRDAVVAERVGFDCAKGHPAMGNYHHHQNPSAFNLDLNVVSTVCNIYAADGLYSIDSTMHSPLIGFAYDGFPIYGAYAYKNIDGTGGIVRMKSSYTLRNITTRTTYSNGNSVTPGPAVSSTYPLGYFREDYQYNPTSAATPDYLDEHNGRFCVTPEYPNGIYCYFATVDANWNSAYPYVVGPTFYGVRTASRVTSITEAVTQYSQGSSISPAVTGLSCTNAQTTAGAANTVYSGNAVVPYTGGNGVAYSSGTAVASTGVNGLTAILQAGTLANGNGNLTFAVTGTPTSAGTASFNISFGGQSCVLNITINNGVPNPPTVSSILCSSAQTTPGTVNTPYTASVSIPYTGGNGLPYISGPSISSTNVTGLTAVREAGTLANGNGNFIYNISGTPTSAGNADFTITLGAQTCTLTIVINDIQPPLMPSVASLDCSNAQVNPGTVNSVYTGNAILPYTGGNGAVYPFVGPSVSSTGVVGLTAQIQPGTLFNGDGNLTIAITGTPATSGIASFAIDFGGQACTLIVPVNQVNPTVSSLDCNGATILPTAFINTVFNGTATIAYTGGNGAAYTSGAEITSSGVTGLMAQLQSGTLANGNGSLVYNISGTALSTGTASFTVDFGGQTCILKVNVVAASSNAGFGFHVQPNPVEKSILKLVFDNADTKVNSVWIVDAVGRTVMTISHPDLSSLTDGIDVSKLPKGAYVIKIQDEVSKIALSKKFVKAD